LLMRHTKTLPKAEAARARTTQAEENIFLAEERSDIKEGRKRA
jgi:hypothetical protein